jgi:hypothetical protein
MCVPTTVRRRVGQGHDATERRSNQRWALTKASASNRPRARSTIGFDDAYRAKYKICAYLQPMIDIRARSATVKIVLAGVERKFPNVWSSNQSGGLA